MNDEWRSRFLLFSFFETTQIQPTTKLPQQEQEGDYREE